MLAAFADGAKAEAERTEIRRFADMLAHEAGTAHLAGVYRKVLLRRVDVASVAGGFEAPEQRLRRPASTERR